MTPLNIYLLYLSILHSPINALQSPPDPTLTWGPYRPNLYFGLRPRIPETLLIALMWGHGEDDNNLRYTCEQNENMAGYGWESYDARVGGTHVVHDVINKVDFTTHFVKMPNGEWGVRVQGKLRGDAPEGMRTSVVFHVAMEGGSYDRGNANLRCGILQDEGNDVEREKAVCRGDAAGLGDFSIRTFEPIGESHVDEGREERQDSKLTIYNFTAPEADVWKAKSIFVDLTNQDKNQQSSISGEPQKGNMQFIQKTFTGPFEFDILFSSSSSSSPAPITSNDLTAQLQNITDAFQEKWKQTYSPKAPFLGAKYSEFSQSLLANLMGGIGYFYGNNSVSVSSPQDSTQEKEKSHTNIEAETRGPYQLFTSVPSRPFFPRGFLWDEGFHLQVILEWDMDLALSILQSWFSLMDEDGWIAREQILGGEAESKVPPEFRVQYREHANPPTLFLVVGGFVDRLERGVVYEGRPSRYLGDEGEGREYLRAIYPLLLRHYSWFRRTQSGDLEKRPQGVSEGYRWRGRTHRHTFASGLDDYPRPEPPDQGELHVDAISWVGLMASSLHKISNFLDMNEDRTMFELHIREIKESIEELHWSDEHQSYCDATVEEGIHVLKCHKGYISLFPFLVGLLEPEHPRLEAVLDLIRNERELWSHHGLRSLSKSSPLYGTGENYWRGPIWININYLVLERLLDLARSPGPFQHRALEIYTELRQNIVSTVYNSWRETGFAWEQYNAETGAGQRTQHFTGWTALVVKIMAFPDLGEGRTPDWRDFEGSERWWLKKEVLVLVVALVLGSWFRRRLLRLWRGVMVGR